MPLKRWPLASLLLYRLAGETLGLLNRIDTKSIGNLQLARVRSATSADRPQRQSRCFGGISTCTGSRALLRIVLRRIKYGVTCVAFKSRNWRREYNASSRETPSPYPFASHGIQTTCSTFASQPSSQAPSDFPRANPRNG